jgi:hypothetical protein
VDPMPMLDNTIRRGGGRVLAVQQPLPPQPPRAGHHRGMRRDGERKPVGSREKTDRTSELLTTDDSELLNYNDDNDEV